jgi:hypothetical protein
MNTDKKFTDPDGDLIGLEKPTVEWDDKLLLYAEQQRWNGETKTIYVNLTPKQARKLAKALKTFADIIDPPIPTTDDEA